MPSLADMYRHFIGTWSFAYSNDGSQRFLWNVDECLPNYMVSHSRTELS